MPLDTEKHPTCILCGAWADVLMVDPNDSRITGKRSHGYWMCGAHAYQMKYLVPVESMEPGPRPCRGGVILDRAYGTRSMGPEEGTSNTNSPWATCSFRLT